MPIDPTTPEARASYGALLMMHRLYATLYASADDTLRPTLEPLAAILEHARRAAFSGRWEPLQLAIDLYRGAAECRRPRPCPRAWTLAEDSLACARVVFLPETGASQRQHMVTGVTLAARDAIREEGFLVPVDSLVSIPLMRAFRSHGVPVLRRDEGHTIGHEEPPQTVLITSPALGFAGERALFLARLTDGDDADRFVELLPADVAGSRVRHPLATE